MGGPTPPSVQNATDFRAYEDALLSTIGAPHSQANYDTIARWSAKEGTSARYNYLATTLNQPGSTNFNSVGVKNYSTPAAGGTAAGQTLLAAGLYPNILTMFRTSTPSPQWSAGARYDLDTWAHGPSGVHNGTYSHFLGGAVPAAPGGTGQKVTTVDGAPSDPFGLGALGASIGTDVSKVLFFVGGGLLMLSGLLILTLVLVRGAAAPVARTAALATPAGRAFSVVQGGLARKPAPAAPAEKPLSPAAQSAVSEAKAGRGTKLSPDVKRELRSRAS